MTDAQPDEAVRARARQLLEAQIRFVQAELAGERFTGLVASEVDFALVAADELVLDNLVNRDQIKATAHKYVATIDIHGSIPELAGEIAARIYGHRTHEEHRIGEVVDTRQVEALVTKLLELPLGARLTESPLAISMVSWWTYRITIGLVADHRDAAERVPGVSALLAAGGRVVGRVAPDVPLELDVRLRELAERGARLLLNRANAPGGPAEESPLYDAVIDLWREQADRPISAFRDVVSQDDVEDLLILGYEFWRALRGTDYLRALIDEGIDFFYDKYGDFTLRALLEEFGIGRDDLIEEGLRFGPPVIEVLVENGMLADVLRRRLEPFFLSDEVLALLA